MEEKTIEHKNEMTAEEILERKKKVIDELTDSIMNDHHFLILTGNPGSKNGTNKVMMGGSIMEISQLLAMSMTRLEALDEIVDLASQALGYAKKMTESRSGKGDHNPLDCENCEAKNECDIFNTKMKMKDSDNPVELIMSLLDTITSGHRPKGEC